MNSFFSLNVNDLNQYWFYLFDTRTTKIHEILNWPRLISNSSSNFAETTIKEFGILIFRFNSQICAEIEIVFEALKQQ